MDNSCSHEEVIIAGFGGQGIMLTGKVLAQTAMKAGREVTYMPAYGAEVRGGTANCAVVIADEPIASPLVSDPDSLIIMNKASLTKFAPRLKSGGLLVINSSLVDSAKAAELADTKNIVAIAADDIAAEVGSGKSANMVALGAYLAARGILDVELAGQCIGDVLAKRYHKTLPVNIEAMRRGAELVKTNI